MLDHMFAGLQDRRSHVTGSTARRSGSEDDTQLAAAGTSWRHVVGAHPGRFRILHDLNGAQ